MGSKLEEIGPLSFIDKNGNQRNLPQVSLLTKFNLMHYFLKETYNDWDKEAQKYQEKIYDTPKDSYYPVGFGELQPLFLKCLFSYAMFFVAIDSAYENLYSQLNRANRLSGLKIKHGKPPKDTSAIKKLRKVRHWSIAHVPSDKAEPIDALQAMTWQPLSMGKQKDEYWDIINFKFGSVKSRVTMEDGTVIKAQDLELPGFRDLHKECMEYINSFDEMCYNYLKDMHENK